MALIYDVSFDSTTRVLSLLDKAGNVISSCEVPIKEDPLTLTAIKDNSSVKLTKRGSLSNTYEVNKGNGWEAYSFGTVINLNAGQSCKWRCSAHPTTQSSSSYVYFVMQGEIEASGNCNSMLSRDFENMTSLSGYDYAFYRLFSETKLTKAPELPAVTLSRSCYQSMFQQCGYLVQAPSLPALSIPDSFLSGREGREVHGCYVSMFEGCFSLVQAPALPAMELGKGCYVRMFYGCSALVEAPALPATTLPDVLTSGGTSAPAFGCYSDMFGRCTALVHAPALPATTLGGACYGWMFYECRSLVKAPELPATTLTFACYGGMFEKCTSLNEIRVSATDISAVRCTLSWLQDVSSTGDFYCNPDTAWTTGSNGIPSGWNRRNISLLNALTLTATANNSGVGLRKYGTLSNTYEVNTGSGWQSYTFGTVINLNAGQSCKWRCSAHPTTQSSSNYVQFNMRGKIEASGNVNSMLSSDFDNLTSLSGYDYAFYKLFSGCTSLINAPELPATSLAPVCYMDMFENCTSLTNAPELPSINLATECYRVMFWNCTSLTNAPSLPATTLAEWCYAGMFGECTSLTNAPSLPATTLAERCYDEMFYSCTSLTNAPSLPATTLAERCYAEMFWNCTSLTNAPSLPDTSLAYECCYDMFKGCTSLTNAPSLPATTLAGGCYFGMFRNCTSLTNAPSLPATTLEERCYSEMFKGCSALTEVRIAATTTASDALRRWLSVVSDSGTVYADPNFTGLPTNSVSGIPKGWTRLNIADYPQT